MELFLCALTLCHTVHTSNGGENYNATSPDEKALVEAMKKLDIVFEDDDDDMMAVKILGQTKIFKKLDVLEFSSGESIKVLKREQTTRIKTKYVYIF